ncbi:MAG: hypothetical protein RR595_10945 [Lysinibacillus sp.]
MKRVILIALAMSHIIISIVLFFVGRHYAFVNDSMNDWVSNLVIGLATIKLFIFLKQVDIERIPSATLVVYPLGLILIVYIAFHDLPEYSYNEAVAIVERESNEEVIIPLKGVKKGQLGMYFIYTKYNF